MDIRTGGHRGARAPHYSIVTLESASFRVTWLLSLKALKMQKVIEKYVFPAISEDPSPLIGLHSEDPWTKC